MPHLTCGVLGEGFAYGCVDFNEAVRAMPALFSSFNNS